MTDAQHRWAPASCCSPPRRETVSAAPRAASNGTASTTPTTPVAPDSAAKAALVVQLAAAASSELSMIGFSADEFRMGSVDPQAYPEDGEGPVRSVRVEAFAISSTTVTVAQFAQFVQATGHLTDAERHGDALVFQGLLARELRDAAPAPEPSTPWWRQVRGAAWFAPEGPGSTAAGREDHPVTQVSRRDAQAYASWVGARLPSETEWEYAARGGLDQQPYPWGADRDPGGQRRMNIFPGEFPEGLVGEIGTRPAESFAPNGYGLFNTTGNVWEWTASGFTRADGSASGSSRSGAYPVMRGGSYMCHRSYCRRYRTSARTSASADTSLGHTGFRLAFTPARPG
ncbi:SUMF1/EgtB/PvdO family nonheme iron enzyme [Nesterenkonia aurantiaca]|uniref:Formylglycine-generating enzyme required for sulfatase activity n=1 Tax=Nesterenkonia aurantiaca TaxID=1436010 RepID=A0A4R7G6Z1_9MICC|nr:SUMF1/EgtB/PvdO family nonheme iron enzyme [Nesterenkonia aurantiaca]TDS87288.1 formylglycine-generating enzyme required for sulfatase activity [Nesterenkonia aurantiaca]